MRRAPSGPATGRVLMRSISGRVDHGGVTRRSRRSRRAARRTRRRDHQSVSSRRHPRELRLARDPVRAVARDLHRVAPLLADRRQVPAGPHAVAEPLVARDLLRRLARAVHVAGARPSRRGGDFVRPAGPQRHGCRHGWTPGSVRSRTDVGCRIPRPVQRPAAFARRDARRLRPAQRGAEPHPVQRGSRGTSLRRRGGGTLLQGPGGHRPGVQNDSVPGSWAR